VAVGLGLEEQLSLVTPLWTKPLLSTGSVHAPTQALAASLRHHSCDLLAERLD
jgi:hypothetical protein